MFDSLSASCRRGAPRPGIGSVVARLLLVAVAVAVRVPDCRAGTVQASSIAPLGTLFYSAEERAAIVRARLDEPDAPPSARSVKLNGVVKRQSARSTAWVNGQPVADGYTVPLIGRVKVGSEGAVIDGQALRVGQSLELGTRERSDLVAPGSVRARAKP